MYYEWPLMQMIKYFMEVTHVELSTAKNQVINWMKANNITKITAWENGGEQFYQFTKNYK